MYNYLHESQIVKEFETLGQNGTWCTGLPQCGGKDGPGLDAYFYHNLAVGQTIKQY